MRRTLITLAFMALAAGCSLEPTAPPPPVTTPTVPPITSAEMKALLARHIQETCAGVPSAEELADLAARADGHVDEALVLTREYCDVVQGKTPR